MKKWIGAICSGVAGVLTFVFLSLSNLRMKMSFMGESESEGTNAWDMLKDVNEEVKGYTLWKIATILVIAVGVLLIVSALLLTLKNLNVIKGKFNFNKLNNILLSVFAFVVIMMLIGLFVMGNDMSAEAFGAKLSVYPAVGAWFNLVVSLAACACGWIFARKAE